MNTPLVRITAAVLACAVLAACGEGKKEDKKEEAAVPVEVGKVTVGPIDAAYRGTATLEAEDEATVLAKTSGVIEQITEVQMPTNHHRGLGAVVGGLGGLGIGSLIGAGTGRDVAMVLGTLGGAVLGNNVQKKYDQPEQGQQIIVRVTSGVLVMVTQPVDSRLRPGMGVYIEGNGDGARVIPR